MNKRLLFFAFLLLAICNKIAAEDQITIDDFSVSAGGSKEVGVMLTNEESYVGFQFDLYLPEGIAVDTFSVDGARIPEGTTLQMAQQADGAYRFIAFSQDRQPIMGNSGAVMTITVKANDNLAVGDYTGYLRNVKISTDDASGVVIAEQSFAIEVKGDEPYAVLIVDSTSNPTGGDVEYDMILYYDNKRDSRGTTLDVGDVWGEWTNIATFVKTVTFDSSFANYYPTSTALWFSGFSNMTTINGMENLRTDNVTDMNMMFLSCTSLESIDVSHFNTAQVADMSSLFAECASLTELDLSSFQTSAVTNMEWMFYTCSSLQKILVSNSWVIGDLTSSQEMFGECSSLVGGMGTAYDAEYTDATYACIDLASSRPGYFTPKGGYVTKPTFSWSGDELSMTSEEGATIMYAIVKSDEATGSGIEYNVYVTPIPVLYDALISIYAVKDDKGQSETVTFNYPYTSWKALADAISAANDVLAAAQGNENVTDEQRNELAAMITAAQNSYNARTDSVASVNNMAGQLTIMSDSVLELVNAVDEPYAVLSDNNTVLTFYYDKKKEERSGMGVGPFSHYSQRPWQTSADAITTIVIDNSFAQCDTLTNIAWWFYELKNLTQINGMANLKTDHVTDMSHLFAVSWSLPSVDVSHFNTSNVTNMEGMFTSCWALTNLDVSNFNTEKVTNMAGMFNSLSGITTLDISNFNTASVTNMQGIFGSNQSLTTIFVGNGWSTASVTENGGSSMFSGSTSIMGGMGTVYDANHVDADYAHIDGGTQNPGYLTPKNGYGMAANPTFTHEGNLVFVNSATEGATIRYTIDDEAPTDMTGIIYSDGISVTRNCTIRAIAVKENFTPSEVAEYNVNWFKVEMPTIAWVGDQLIATTTTEGAVVQYTLTQSGVETPLDQGGESSPLKITVTQDAIITLYATKQDWTNSDTLVIDYLYTLWQRLVTAIDDATNTANRGENNQKVDPQMVHQLREMIQDAQGMYSERTEERSRIEWMIDELSMMIAEINVQMSSADFAYDGQTLTVSGNTTLTAAVETAGGKARVSKTITAIFWESTQTITGDSLKLMNITNPNLLLYVNTADQAPADVQNVIVGDVAKLIVLTDADTLTNGNFNCPRPFVAQRITYTRNFQQRTQTGVSRGWETLALPFNVQVIYKEDGTELVPFAANSQDDRTRPFWLKNISGGELTDADAIEANKPYLLSLPNDPTVYPADYCLSGNVRFISENVTVPETNPETNYLGENDIALVPTFSLVPFATDVYALNVGMERENHAEGSIFESGLRSVRPFECYSVHLNASGPAPAFMSVADLMNGGLTDIDTVKRDYDSNDNDDWYTLDGRKLQTRPTTKGLYIHQGRKVVVK